MGQKSRFYGTAEFLRFDRVTCRGCCGCYGWDNFDPKAVSESLKQMLQMRKKIIALSQSWQEWQPAENRPRKPLFSVKKHVSCSLTTCLVEAVTGEPIEIFSIRRLFLEVQWQNSAWKTIHHSSSVMDPTAAGGKRVVENIYFLLIEKALLLRFWGQCLGL